MKRGTIGEAEKSITLIFFRYVSLLLVVYLISSFDFFSRLIFYLTIYPIKFILGLFYEVFLLKNFIVVDNLWIEIIPACLAVSAYILLIGLNLSVKMNIRKRIFTLLFSSLSLLLLNILRIILLSLLLLNNNPYFDLTHKIFWYGLSIIFVIGIWFLSVKLFKVRGIPFYSDIIYIIKQTNKKGKK